MSAMADCAMEILPPVNPSMILPRNNNHVVPLIIPMANKTSRRRDKMHHAILQTATDYLKKTEDKESITLDDIWSYCLELWQQEDLNVKMLYKVSVLDYTEIDKRKHGFIIVFMKLLKHIESFEDESEAELINYAEIIYATYIPLLQNLANDSNYETRFKKGMTGLIKGIVL
jgi:hypothetical protein